MVKLIISNKILFALAICLPVLVGGIGLEYKSSDKLRTAKEMPANVAPNQLSWNNIEVAITPTTKKKLVNQSFELFDSEGKTVVNTSIPQLRFNDLELGSNEKLTLVTTLQFGKKTYTQKNEFTASEKRFVVDPKVQFSKFNSLNKVDYNLGLQVERPVFDNQEKFELVNANAIDHTINLKLNNEAIENFDIPVKTSSGSINLSKIEGYMGYKTLVETAIYKKQPLELAVNLNADNVILAANYVPGKQQEYLAALPSIEINGLTTINQKPTYAYKTIIDAREAAIAPEEVEVEKVKPKATPKPAKVILAAATKVEPKAKKIEKVAEVKPAQKGNKNKAQQYAAEAANRFVQSVTGNPAKYANNSLHTFELQGNQYVITLSAYWVDGMDREQVKVKGILRVNADGSNPQFKKTWNNSAYSSNYAWASL